MFIVSKLMDGSSEAVELFFDAFLVVVHASAKQKISVGIINDFDFIEMVLKRKCAKNIWLLKSIGVGENVFDKTFVFTTCR
jgi:hypothetical protein